MSDSWNLKPSRPVEIVDVVRDGVRLYICMCSSVPHTGCGCRLTNPSSYWGDDGRRHFYIDEEDKA